MALGGLENGQIQGEFLTWVLFLHSSFVPPFMILLSLPDYICLGLR